MTVTRFSQFLAILAITLLATSCVSPTSAPPTLAPISPTTAPTQTPTAEAQLTSQIDDFITALAKQDRFSGSILVAKEGQVLISKGYGMANLELDVPNTPQTKFRIGSITKQFTAMAILQLQQQGKLNVQDPICQYIRDCPQAWQPITIHHLLTHTSGIKDYTSFPNFSDFGKQSMSPIELIELFRDLPLEFTPGESWNYSNSGYILLGYIIEAVSGEPYGIFLLKNIFIPLQMEDTGYDNNHTILKNRADGYFSSTANADYFDQSVAYAAGGLYSTVEDLFRWDQALYTDVLIPQALRVEMFTPFSPIPVSPSDAIPDGDISYGYGWRIGTQLGHPWTFHTGTGYGFHNLINRYPDDKVFIVLLGNRESAVLGDISREIAQMVFGEK